MAVLQYPGEGPAKGQAEGQPSASPRTSQGPGQGPVRVRLRPRASQGQAKGQPGPGQGPFMHHGACLAMNEHPRIMDVILSQMRAPIKMAELLPKMMAFDKTMLFLDRKLDRHKLPCPSSSDLLVKTDGGGLTWILHFSKPHPEI